METQGDGADGARLYVLVPPAGELANNLLDDLSSFGIGDEALPIRPWNVDVADRSEERPSSQFKGGLHPRTSAIRPHVVVELCEGREHAEVCEFVREIISARTREPIALTGRPDRERRDVKAVEELWESSSRRYAIEHTLIESSEGQLANLARIERLLVPVKDMLAGRLPGRFALAVRETDTSAARVNFAVAHQEVARLVLDAVDGLKVGETVTLGSKALPFELRLHLRFEEDSRLI